MKNFPSGLLVFCVSIQLMLQQFQLLRIQQNFDKQLEDEVAYREKIADLWRLQGTLDAQLGVSLMEKERRAPTRLTLLPSDGCFY